MIYFAHSPTDNGSLEELKAKANTVYGVYGGQSRASPAAGRVVAMRRFIAHLKDRNVVAYGDMDTLQLSNVTQAVLHQIVQSFLEKEPTFACPRMQIGKQK